MKAAVILSAGSAPEYGEFREPQAAPGKRIIRVTGAAISHLTKLRASGQHYSGGGEYPLVPGVDGTGVTDDGRRVYFFATNPPFGAMAQRCIAGDDQCIELPDGIADDVAAAMANPGMSSWAALVDRAAFKAGESVLINGATGVAGRLAIQIAKHLGAKRIVATGRRVELFDELRALGAAVTIGLRQDGAALRAAFETEFRNGIDVVLDYLWGESAEAILAATNVASKDKPIRYVNIGSMAGPQIALPAFALRSTPLAILGSGFGSVSPAALLDAIRGVFAAAPSAGFSVAVRPMPLAEIATAWSQPESDARIVLVPE